ncbi:MAG TPA: sensor histidine kinase [Longimicrobiales bacterium]|nr:sensor histidine kinase [Longimicrobiales bacterium]
MDRDLAGRRLLAVTEEELQRIILDIHDGPVQNLFAALSQLSVVRRRLTEADDPAIACTAPLNTAMRLLETSLDGIRNVLTVFHAPEFQELDLTQMIEELGVQHETLTSEPVTCEIGENIPRVPLIVKIVLFRILQEALSNIRRHAGVPRATVRLQSNKARLTIEIEDYGKGFSPPPLAGPLATENAIHIGLRGMRERAAMVNGEFAVVSKPGTGTCVKVEIPLNDVE